ncbi:nitroreductase family protein (plasmid) [Rhodococcus sp. USK10]|nr:nitroreductase family protein [Rhodococcus sp. USK10]
MDYHRVEKGLTLPEPRPWFGRDTVERLVRNCSLYIAGSTADAKIAAAAIGALTAYQEQFDDGRCEWWNAISHNVADLQRLVSSDRENYGGVEASFDRLSKLRLTEEWKFSALANSRSSVRNFGPQIVGDDILLRAIRTAQTAPSVCNRQSGRVRSFKRGSFASGILALQNGNRGFGDTASHVLVVTSDLNAFVTPGERNQAFIDGGMFAMTLVYALHDLGTDSCCLNWSTVKNEDDALRRYLDLPDDEIVIMLIAVGYAADGAKVTRSPKRDIWQVYSAGDPLSVATELVE